MFKPQDFKKMNSNPWDSGFVRDLMDTVHGGVFLLDRAFTILTVNETATQLTNYSREELVGESITLLFDEMEINEDLLAFMAAQENDLMTLKTKSKQIRVVRRRFIDLSKDSDSPCRIIFSLEDMTERLGIFDNYEKIQRILKAFTLSIKELIDTADYHKALISSLTLLGKASMADRIFLYVLEEDPSRPPVFNLSFGWGKTDLNIGGPGTIKTALPLETLEKHLPGLLSGRPYHGLAEDVASPELQQYLHRQGTLAMIVFPVFIQEDFWGFLGFDQCTLADIWPPEVFSTLGAFVSSLEKTIERHLMQRDLTLAWETAEKASAMKSQFLSNMSHEIRTPINAILGYTSLLEDIISQEEGRHYLSAVQKAGNMLVGLISDILDLAKIESGEIKLQQDYINVRRIYEDIVDVFELKTKENQITLEIQVDPSVPDLIIQDETRFRQILFNLVGNAVKFTHEGGIVISARQLAFSEETGTVDLTFSVKDTGIGIPEGEQEKIFDPFKQKDNQNASVYGGTGLGLSIARRLVEQMGGEIRLHSREGEGSEFILDLYQVKTVGATGSFSAMMKQARALEKGPVRSRAAASEPSAEVIPPEAKTLLETIQGDAWLHARQTQSMDSSRRFAGEVAGVAGNYDLSALKNYSENLAEALGTYNARKIRELLEAFPRVAAIEGGDGS